MLSAGSWKKNQPNTILFVLIDSNGLEITGLGAGFTLQISKAGNPFSAGGGSKAEVGLGWYSYTSTSGEADTSGPVAITVTAAGALQQNLEYVVEDRIVTAVEFTYTVLSTAGSVPLENVQVAIYTDVLATNIVWYGETDVMGIARDEYGLKPRLAPGVYYFFRTLAGYIFDDPDVETVS